MKKFFNALQINILICSFFTVTIYSPVISSGFENLQDIQAYAKKFPEIVKSDNRDWVNPEYEKFFRKNFHITWFGKMLNKIGLLKPAWDAHSFKNIITKVTDYRTSKNLKSQLTKTLKVKKGDTLIIFGDLHGAFDSMERNLQELLRLGFIRADLTITNKNTYIVIIGDAISRSPYSAELLNIIVLLMHKNPENVVYLQGNHEKNEYWENFSLAHELKEKASLLEQDTISKIPLREEINKLFSTLANTLIIEYKKIENKKAEKILLSHNRIQKEFNQDPNIKLIIIGEQRLESIKETHGLEFLGYHQGAAKWSTLACPTQIYQDFFSFFFDAFTQLTVGKTVQKSILTLHNHDVRKEKKSKGYTQTNYDPLFGFELKNKKPISQTKNIIKIGSSMYLTGIYWDLGKEIKSGVETALINHNKTKPANLIIPFILDDQYEPRKATQNIKTLYEKYKINKIIMPTGTPTLASYLDIILSGKITAFFPASGAPKFRSSEIKNIINLRSEYITEAKNLIRYLIEKYEVKRFAFFYERSGKDIIKELHEELKKHGIVKWLDLEHIKRQDNFDHFAKKIADFSPEAIGCYSAQFPTQSLISSLGADYFIKHYIFMPSALYTRNFKKFLDNRGISFVVSSVVPEPQQSNLAIAKEHCKLMLDTGLIPTIHSFLGYIAGKLFAQATDKITSPITNKKLLQYFENLKNYNFEGLHISFDPKTRELLKDTWIRTLDKRWIRYQNVKQKENK
ncbi:ABC transporter substrate-binding protein [Candidatus Dependentiae bacterium]